MLVDYHIHTYLCGHARGEPEEYVKVAEKKGLAEIGFADHLPQYFLPEEKRDRGLAMTSEELPLYFQKMKKMQNDDPGVLIKVGLEADFIPGKEKELENIISSWEVDYMLGSVHFIGEWGLDQRRYISEYKKRGINQVYEQYLHLVQGAALSGIFDILSHPDLVKKFNFHPTEDITDLLRETVAIIHKADMVVEINTSGLRKPVQEIYPSREFLSLCFEYGVPITFGSDAHQPEEVGKDFEQAIQLTREVGYREVVTFSRRKRQFRPLG